MSWTATSWTSATSGPTVPDLFLLMDAEARVIRANRAWERTLGHPPDELCGTGILRLVHPDDREATIAAVTAAAGLPAGERAELVNRMCDRAGGHHWMKWHTIPLPGRDLFAATARDITDDITRRRIIDERAQLLDLTQDAVIVRGMDGRIRYWNPAAEHVYGWPAEVATGHDLDRLLGTAWPGGTGRDEITELLHRDGRWEGEVEHCRADGRRVTILSRKALQRDAAGEPIGILAINTDVTARRDDERALAASEQRIRSQFTHSSVGQMIRGLDDVIEDVNPAFAAMLGYTRDELIGSPAARLYDPAKTAARTAALAGMVAGVTDSVSAEGHLVRADGSLLDVHMNIAAVRGADGRPQRFAGVFQDIAARKSAEAQRDAAMATLASQNTRLE
ncbi:PAS domain-containing protein [Actinoplanes sp. NPDC051851]|uniref:PAS domain-containing protein n=1 Tax=Actinoplanes sp. NPDC051851 TaxID=3154753 RepID=UPI00341CD8F8